MEQKPSDSLQDILKEAAPYFVKDGFGIRGNPTSALSDQGFAPAYSQFPNNLSVTATLPDTPFLVEDSVPEPSVTGSTSSKEHFGFQVLTQKDGSVTKAGVYYGSKLLKSLAPDDNLSITGLLTSTTPSPSDSGWFTVVSGDKVWLEVSVLNATATSAQIKHDNSFSTGAAAWSSGAYVEDDGADLPKQTKARKLIATFEGGSTISVLQHVSSNLVMFNMCIEGQSALYPLPY